MRHLAGGRLGRDVELAGRGGGGRTLIAGRWVPAGGKEVLWSP